MKIACKCGNCGHIEIPKDEDDSVLMEIDFLEKKIVFICRQCKKNNTINLAPNDDKKVNSLPQIKLMR